MDHNKYNLRAALLLLSMLLTFTAEAQQKYRVFKFNTGDEYQTDILTTSNAIIQRGKQTITANTISTASKAFSAILANDRGYTFNVKIKKMENDINIMGQKLHYSSVDSKKDTNSTIIKALDFMLDKSIDVQVNKEGIIQSFTDYKAEMATDTLVSFAGLQPEAFEKGTMLSFIASFTYNPNIKKNFTWTDSVEIDKQRLVTKFWVEDITEKTTIVKFSSAITSKLLNTNQNGTYVIDNGTGIIQEKILYSISTGYQMSASGVVYAVSRSTSVSEKTRKVK
ncbi:hypothetical protein [Pedobacter insulae]|uniref:GLPGLI family protein n=1 Tax=Pedobacter insulae TaxID=414048 RepID=A0A1I2X811_9SPHI|nr:hypothetical protein [Pedobacter insulae]SFH08836.1 hypothetical protein SAMN04489864_10513 [Pedobacter insulae]